jgi:phosphate transport system permease protein
MSFPDHSQPVPSALDLAQRRLTAGMVLRTWLVWGIVGGACLSLALVALIILWSLGHLDAPRWTSVLAVGGWSFLVGFVLGSLLGLLGLSRPWQNRTFTATGFLATFLGLAILGIFFWGLIADVVRWFHYTPIFVEMKNQETLKVREKLKSLEKVRDTQRQKLEGEYQQALAEANTAEEKKEVTQVFLGDPEKLRQLELEENQDLSKAKTAGERKKIRAKYTTAIRALGYVFPENLREYDVTLIDDKAIADQPLRDTSALAVLGHFLFETPSSDAEAVGIKPALFGSLWISIIMILFAVPVGVGAALYLEEYKTSGRLGQFIQTNINNLAGVPSIVYGILGAFVFVELIFKPLHMLHDGISVRNLLGGGLTLGLLTLPVIIVATQEAIRAVPQSIRHGAYALGATQWQVTWHHVLPLARPGIFTGTILAVSRAIGEAAPLVLFGATTFIAFTPNPFTDFTVLPIQIFNWAERPTNPELHGEVIRLWNFNMAMASMVLLVILLLLNACAIWMRNRAQKKVRW